MRKIKLLIVLMIIFTKSYSQSLTFKYQITKDSTFHIKKDKSIGDDFFKLIRNSWDHIDPDNSKELEVSRSFFMNKPTLETDVINYKIKGSGIFFLWDVWGHQILLDPSLIKDTVQLSVQQNKDTPLGSGRYYLNDSITSSTIFNITYPPKYKYIGFFDSLTYLHGSIHGMQDGYSFKKLNHDLGKYLKGITRIYQDRMIFFKDFVQKYGMPKSLQLYARKEIQYSYYNHLLIPLEEWNAQLYSEYPKAIQDTINNFKNDLNNVELFQSTSLHRYVLYQYIGVMNRGTKQGPLNYDQRFLKDVLPYNKKMLRGEIQSYMMAWLMQVYSGQGDTSAVKMLHKQYQPDNGSPAINKLVDSVYQTAMHPGIPPQEMLNLSFENSLHSEIKFKNLATRKVILIDCWATWCIPCRAEMPYLNDLAKKYDGMVQFISLSADQDLRKWDKWISQNVGDGKDILQLHAKGGFENIFFKRFMINAIPRYMLLSNSGEVLNIAMPRPSDQAQFELELNKYLKSN